LRKIIVSGDVTPQWRLPMTRFVTAVLLMMAVVTQAHAADLILKHVMMSSGGVGYFEYVAEIDGDAALGLDVPLSQVDDVLKSLVVFDSGGGVAGVELPGRDNTVQAFGDAPFGPEALKSPTAYLNALSGTEVTVQGPRPMTGRIVSAEPETQTTDKTSTQRTRVTLLGADGLRQFVLEDADTVQVTDPTLRARIEQALESLRRDASLTTRHLTIRLKGKGKRSVAVGYVAGAPLWKATYRLMLAPAPSSTARLQVWATLENQSGADWKGVTLTLQYGNPVTFRQALYRSYFVQRPEVPVEILGHVLPDIDTQARDAVQTAMTPAPMPAPMVAPPIPSAMVHHKWRSGPAQTPEMAPPADAAESVESAEETIFTLTQTVDLLSGHTANVPIVDRDFPAPRIDLLPFQTTYPLAAVRLRNDDTRSLPAGVLTIYDQASGASFAGDARLGGLPAGESRLLSYAQDLRTTAETSLSPQPDTFVAFSVADGVLTYTVRMRQVIHISVTAPAKESRDVLLEIPRSDGEQTLTLDDGKTHATEQTATAFRIAISLAPGETHSVTAWLDQPQRRTEALVDGDDDVLQSIVGADKLNPSGRAALNHVLDLRRDEARKQAEVTRQRKQLYDVQADEDRIRKNLAAVTSADPLRSRMTKALDADETLIEQLKKSIDEAQQAADNSHRALADGIASLQI
jgi:Domain of unknown function (DUF4139)